MIRRTNSIQLPGHEDAIEKNATMNQLREHDYDNPREFQSNQYHSQQNRSLPKKTIEANLSQNAQKNMNSKNVVSHSNISKLTRSKIMQEANNQYHSQTDKIFHNKKNIEAIRSQYVEKNSKRSNAEPSINRIARNKIPEGVVNSIRKNASGKKAPDNSKKLNVSKYLLKKIREARKEFVCQICQCEYPEQQKSKLCGCPHEYCDSCLQHYVIYKVGMFQEVVCPDDGCDIVMDKEFSFYKSLPDDIKKKYVKVNAFYVAAKDPSLKLCPSQNCEQGILKLIEDEDPTCNVCGKTFCHKCFFLVHEGPCEKNEIDFFENNLHYRQCASCKAVIERNQGCNHMTCRCGYEFCYMCGKKWDGYGHLCPNGQNNVQNNINNQQDGVLCCQDGFCRNFGRVLIFPIFLVLVSLVTVKFILLIAMVFVLSIFVGMFPMACQIIGDCAGNSCMGCIMLIFFPIFMILGIFKSFAEFFCAAAGEIGQQYCQQLSAAGRCLCN